MPKELRLQEVLAANLARIRRGKGWRQDDLAREARRANIQWTRSIVAKVEAGHRQLSLEELLLVPDLLGVPLEELLVTDGDVYVYMDNVIVPGRRLRDLPKGLGAVLWDEAAPSMPLAGLSTEQVALANRYELTDEEAGFALYLHGDAEEKAARTLGRSPQEVAFAAMALWGTSLGKWRDKILEDQSKDGSAKARRGHVTRDLL
jgi:transcriptional regulator with XRE-family HTH domain